MNTIMMQHCLFKEGYFHTMDTEDECYRYMGVTDGRISYLGDTRPGGYFHECSLEERHVFPALIDSHLHLLYTMVLQAGSCVICEIRDGRVVPDTLDGVRQKIEEVCKTNRSKGIIVANQYIVSGIREGRMPNRQELDQWTEGRKIVLYNIDGHSSSMSTALMKELGIYQEGCDGILTGKDHEFIQGKVMESIGKAVTPKVLARGVANFTNLCIQYGIGGVCALDGSGDVPEDKLTRMLAKIASHMDIDVRLYPQFTDLTQAEQYRRYQSTPRVGGCGVWEMDGSVGSHSAAFYSPYRDTGTKGACYYTQEQVDDMLRKADEAGYQISSHAIGEAAIDRVLDGYAGFQPRRMHRIDHFEFPTPEAVKRICAEKNLAVTVQPGFSWIDRHYLKSYEQFLPDALIEQQVPLRTLMEHGVCVCGSSDSPVQEINPFDQMLGMIDFYRPEESLTMYQALCTYTKNPAAMLGEERDLGTLEVGKRANFLVSDQNLLELDRHTIGNVQIRQLYLDGKACRRKKGSVAEFLAMMAGPGHKI